MSFRVSVGKSRKGLNGLLFPSLVKLIPISDFSRDRIGRGDCLDFSDFHPL